MTHGSSPSCELDVQGNSCSSADSSSRNDTAEGTGSRSIVQFRKSLQRTCPYATCTYEGVFPRQYELDRHIRVKHDGKKPYSCPFPGCYRGITAPSYPRADKLTSHIRNVHGRHTEQLLKCGYHWCRSSTMTLDLLGVHIRRAHSDTRVFGKPPSDGKARALLNAASPKYRQCPLWRCAKQLPLSNIIQHLAQHSTVDLEDATADLSLEGYAISNEARVRFDPKQTDQEVLETYACSGVRVRVRCPMCNDIFETHEYFQLHVREEHFIAEGQKEHFQLWREYAKGLGRGYNFAVWQDWGFFQKKDDLRCPYCGYITPNMSDIDHHTSMLADPEAIKPHRRAILKLYPEFATHPVWKDLD